jgi:hypothetical protein
MLSIVARVLGPADELPAVAWYDGKVGQVSNTGRAAGTLVSSRPCWPQRQHLHLCSGAHLGVCSEALKCGASRATSYFTQHLGLKGPVMWDRHWGPLLHPTPQAQRPGSGRRSCRFPPHLRLKGPVLWDQRCDPLLRLTPRAHRPTSVSFTRRYPFPGYDGRSAP